ncbi:MAG: hypothetical protein AABY22_35385 [Nanoarchaeota archaeon]
MNNEPSQEKCKWCGRNLSNLEIYEICGCKESLKLLTDKDKFYTKLDCIATECCKSSLETIHKKGR